MAPSASSADRSSPGQNARYERIGHLALRSASAAGRKVISTIDKLWRGIARSSKAAARQKVYKPDCHGLRANPIALGESFHALLVVDVEDEPVNVLS